MTAQPSIDVNSTISKFFKRDITANLSTLDYSNTRFHNQLVGKHDPTVVVSEALEAQLKQKAFDKAKEEVVRRGQEDAEKQRKRDLAEQNAKKRGNQALQKEKTKQ